MGRTVMRPSFEAVWRFRPRMLTLVLLIFVAATIVLANLSFGTGSNGSLKHKSYGWPLIWHRYVTDGWRTIGWYWSASRLAANLAIWLAMLAATAGVCGWLLRRYQPRFRWSLRTMLAVMGLMAASFAWFATARDRANLQDPIIEALRRPEPAVAVKRRGCESLQVDNNTECARSPQWLLSGAGRSGSTFSESTVFDAGLFSLISTRFAWIWAPPTLKACSRGGDDATADQCFRMPRKRSSLRDW